MLGQIRARTQCLWGFALLLAVTLAGCGVREPLVISAHAWPGYQFLFVARDEALLDASVVLAPARNSSESMQRLREGRAHAAGLTLDEVLQLRDEGIDLRVVLVFNVSDGADMVLAQPEFTAAEQLRGQRIGLEQTSLGALMLRKFLSHSGLHRDEVTLDYIELTEQRQAFEEGRVAALITFQPLAGQLQSLGARALLTTREMPPLIFDVLAVKHEALGQYPSHLRAAISAHFQVLAMLHSNPIDTSYRLARHLGVDGSAVMSSLRGIALPDIHRNVELLRSSALRSIADDLLQILAETGHVKTTGTDLPLFTADYLPEPM
jgi:NitT/TauT family transport system substrate-binding protein